MSGCTSRRHACLADSLLSLLLLHAAVLRSSIAARLHRLLVHLVAPCLGCCLLQARVEQNLQRISELKEESARLGGAVQSLKSAQQAPRATGNGVAELAAAAAAAPAAVAAAAAPTPSLAAGVADAGAHPPPAALTKAVAASRSAVAPGHAQNRACGGAGPRAAQLSLEQEIEAQRRRGLYSRCGRAGARLVAQLGGEASTAQLGAADLLWMSSSPHYPAAAGTAGPTTVWLVAHSPVCQYPSPGPALQPGDGGGAEEPLVCGRLCVQAGHGERAGQGRAVHCCCCWQVEAAVCASRPCLLGMRSAPPVPGLCGLVLLGTRVQQPGSSRGAAHPPTSAPACLPPALAPQDTMIPFDLFGQAWVLFRDQDGKPACILDECAHRACPLSVGRVVDGQAECPYVSWVCARPGLDALGFGCRAAACHGSAA